MTQTDTTAKFDPGWGKHVLVYSGSVEYLYRDINRFKKLGQRSFKFRQYYPKIIQLLENNVGFYLGCLLWASYIKTFGDVEITGNHCLGQKYDEKEPDLEVDYIITSIDKLKRDYKYFVGKDIEIPEIYKCIMITYNEFAEINKGFVDTKTTGDLKLPPNLKTPTDSDLKEIKTVIDEAVETGKLELLIPLADKIL